MDSPDCAMFAAQIIGLFADIFKFDINVDAHVDASVPYQSCQAAESHLRVCFGVTGDDEMAHSLQDMLAGAGVECVFTRLPGHATTTKLRVISRHQQLIRLDFEESSGSGAPPAMVDDLPAQLEGCDVLVLSDYAKGAVVDPRPVIDQARAGGIAVLVDPKGGDFSRYRGATLLTPNLRELEAVALTLKTG